MKHRRQIEAFGRAPKPDCAMGVIGWAAFWAAKTAREIGLFSGWVKGEAAAVGEVARALPLIVAGLERDAENVRHAPQLVFSVSADYFNDFEKGR